MATALSAGGESCLYGDAPSTVVGNTKNVIKNNGDVPILKRIKTCAELAIKLLTVHKHRSIF